jgi:hypothetical protein
MESKFAVRSQIIPCYVTQGIHLQPFDIANYLDRHFSAEALNRENSLFFSLLAGNLTGRDEMAIGRLRIGLAVAKDGHNDRRQLLGSLQRSAEHIRRRLPWLRMRHCKALPLSCGT